MGRLNVNDIPYRVYKEDHKGDYYAQSWVSNYEQGIPITSPDYFYIVYGEDDKWEVERIDRNTFQKTTTGYKTGPKPTTLEDVQDLEFT